MDLIGYDVLVKRAFREVLMKEALKKATGEDGLPGDHHFFITFRTGHPGVEIPNSLHAQYPDEMTIVLQHRFWELDVEDDAFGVGLAFGGVPARLHIPYDAVMRFFDPAVNFLIDLRPTVAAVPDQPDETPVVAELEIEPGDSGPKDDDTGETAQVLNLDQFRK